MLELILGFLLGSFIAEFASAQANMVVKILLFSTATFSAVACLVAAMRGQYLWKQAPAAFFMIFGLLWGALHNWRADVQQSTLQGQAIVIRGNAEERFGRYLIVWMGSSKSLIKVKGAARFGDRGRVRCRSLAQSQQLTCRFTGTLTMHYHRINQWIWFANQLRLSLQQRANFLGERWSAWAMALFLGDWSHLQTETKLWFQRVGIVHLLVLSGLHISLLFYLVEKMFFILLMPIYLSRMIRAENWVSLAFLSFAITTIFGLLYLLAVGFHHPSLRAFFVYLCVKLGRWSCGGQKPIFWISVALIAQVIVVPIGFWERSNVLSWFAYLWLVSGLWKVLSPISSRRKKLTDIILCQLGMTALSAGLVGELSTISMLANLVIGPVFPVIFVTSLLWLSLPQSEFVTHLSSLVLHLFFALIQAFAQRSQVISLPIAFSQTLTMILSSALLCYMFGCYAQQGQQFKTKGCDDDR
ncbi:MAG: ComEC/Rec2 family competence protein [Oligoflexus sp.]